jgi:hypothetical protein
VRTVYPLRAPRPQLSLVKTESDDPEESKDRDGKKGEHGDISSRKPPKIKNHRAVNVRSVIDVHAWDQARWKGTAYAQFDPRLPPCVACMFEDKESARKFFEGGSALEGAMQMKKSIWPSYDTCHSKTHTTMPC